MDQSYKLKIHINGMRYAIVTQEEPTYVAGLAQEIDMSVRAFIQNNFASVNEALVLTALSHLDALKKAEASADNLRMQVTGYAEEAAKARLELQEMQREMDKLERQSPGKQDKK